MLFGPPPEGSTPEQPQPSDEQTCPNCGARLEFSHRFCISCGAPIPSAAGFCPRCGTRLAAGHRFCTNCGADVSGITGAPYAPAPGSYPVQFEVEYPEKLSRLLIFVKLILAIPQFLVVYALGAVIAAVTFVAWFAILFSGRYPRGLFNLVVGFTRWSANVSVYTSYLRDEYPPFAMDAALYPVTYEVEYPERLSRWLIFFKWFLIIPNQFIVAILGFVRLIMIFVAWWAILFTGRYPRGLFDFNVGVLRWSLRANAYAGLLRDEFPPFSTQANARPSGRTAIILSIIGAVLIVIGTAATFAAIAAIDSQTEVVPVSYERLESGAVEPTVRVEGTRVTLNGVDDPYLKGARPSPGTRFVGFHMTVRNEDALFTFVTREAFRLEDTFGETYRPLEDPVNFQTLAEGERARIVVVFEIDTLADPGSLTYAPGFGQFGPFGEKVRFEFR